MKIKYWLVAGLIIAIIVGLGFVYKFRAIPTEFTNLQYIKPNLNNGLYLLKIAGCVGCHQPPHKQKGETDETDELLSTVLNQDAGIFDLSGGYRIKSRFGDFTAPNITPSASNGVGTWDFNDFANALRNGISPDLKHYYPALPYNYYTYLEDQDIVDLFVALRAQPASKTTQAGHDLIFPLNMRFLMGGWKGFFAKTASLKTRFPIDEDDPKFPLWVRGRYLSEAVSHCGACHSPRTLLGVQTDKTHFQGGIDVKGRKIPKIDSASLKRKGYDEEALIFMLQTGILPDGDVVSGDMEKFIETSTSHYKPSDLKAIAYYLLNPVSSP